MRLYIESRINAAAPWRRLSTLGYINDQLHAEKISVSQARAMARAEIARWRATITDSYADIQMRLAEAA